jgi:hypothetical protein
MQLSQRYRMVGGSIEESGRDLWIAEHGQPLAESEVGGHNDQGVLDDDDRPGANALNSRGIVGAGNPGRFAPTSWWS